jgi:TonB family protein
VALIDFSYEVPRPRRWNTFLAGLTINAAVVLLLITVGPRLTKSIPIEPTASNHYVPLYLPTAPPITPPVAHHLPPRDAPVPLQVAKLTPPPVAHVKQPEIQPPKPELPKVAVSTAPPSVRPAPPVQVKTNVFNTPKAEVATIHRPPREIQTGGFGDPNGIAGQGVAEHHNVVVASVGSFELPAGAGKGNGTAGIHGVSGTIRTAGFGDAAVSPGPHGRNSGGIVVASGFNNAVATSGASTPKQVQKAPGLQPVEIVFKPRPIYTAEARNKRVEGEVLLEVVFGASGSLHINRVVKELGYGLDDAAVAAAQHIQFRPARRDGQPYDCAALVHIKFELSE